MEQIQIGRDMKVFGVIEGDTFIKNPTNIHFMVKYLGFGISNWVIARLIQYNVKKVRIHYRGKLYNEIYECSLQQFIDSDKRHTNKNDDGSDDPQKFVSKKDMTLISSIKI